jgi:nucleoside 2-deoxyribosyltransferase
VAKVYRASPLGFAESTRAFMPTIEKTITDSGYIVVNPWRLLGANYFDAASGVENPRQRKIEFHKLNMGIAAGNEKAIRECHMIVAVLDGLDVDSGTSSEIGFAYVLGKRVYGYRSDFRRSGDNEGSIINLQVEYWIENSGGCIVTNLEELHLELVEVARLYP